MTSKLVDRRASRAESQPRGEPRGRDECRGENLCAPTVPHRERGAPTTWTPTLPQARDHLSVARVLLFVGTEIQNPHAIARLAQDLVNDEIDAFALVHALFVLRRDQFREQAERDELHADDDEEHAQRQQWPVTDACTADLDDRQVGRRSSDPTKPMRRPSPPNRCSGRWRYRPMNVTLRRSKNPRK